MTTVETVKQGYLQFTKIVLQGMILKILGNTIFMLPPLLMTLAHPECALNKIKANTKTLKRI